MSSFPTGHLWNMIRSRERNNTPQWRGGPPRPRHRLDMSEAVDAAAPCGDVRHGGRPHPVRRTRAVSEFPLVVRDGSSVWGGPTSDIPILVGVTPRVIVPMVFLASSSAGPALLAGGER